MKNVKSSPINEFNWKNTFYFFKELCNKSSVNKNTNGNSRSIYSKICLS